MASRQINDCRAAAGPVESWLFIVPRICTRVATKSAGRLKREEESLVFDRATGTCIKISWQNSLNTRCNQVNSILQAYHIRFLTLRRCHTWRLYRQNTDLFLIACVVLVISNYKYFYTVKVYTKMNWRSIVQCVTKTIKSLKVESL